MALSRRLRSSGTGILDVAGNAISGGFTAGQSYTIRLPGSGVWGSTESGEVWSRRRLGSWHRCEWLGCDGRIFSTINADGPVIVQLDFRARWSRAIWRHRFHGASAVTVTNSGIAGIRSRSRDRSQHRRQGRHDTTGDTADVPGRRIPRRSDVVLAGTGGLHEDRRRHDFAHAAEHDQRPAHDHERHVESESVARSRRPTWSFRLGSSCGSPAARSARGTSPGLRGTGTESSVNGGVANFQKVLPSDVRQQLLSASDGGRSLVTDINFPRSGDLSSGDRGGHLHRGGNTTITTGLGTGGFLGRE